MSTRDDYLRQAQECAVLARDAQWPETRSVWKQVEKLYLIFAERADCVAKLSPERAKAP